MRLEVSIKSNNKDSKFKINKIKKIICSKFKKFKKKASCSKMLRRVHLYGMKKTFFNIVKSGCHLMDKDIDKKVILCGAGSFCCDHSCILVHEKYVHNSGRVKINNLFCCH